METCKVCWNCRGLFVGEKCTDLAIQYHLKSCKDCSPYYINKESETSTFDFYVCDRSDYKSFTALKRTLSKNGKQFFSSPQTMLPRNILKILLALCSPDLSSKKRTHFNIENQQLKCDKECQTFIHTIPLKNVTVNSATVNLDTMTVTENDSTALFPHQGSIKKFPDTEKPSDTDRVKMSAPLDSIGKLSSQCQISKTDYQTVYICKLCTHQSKTDKLMLRHLLSHNDGQAFECSTCKYSTIWRKDWKHHLLHNHGELKLLCHFCGAEFFRKDAFDQHLATTHYDSESLAENKYKCNACNYVARNMATLKEHKRKHTGEMITCPHEGCSFASLYERSLSKHLKQKHAEDKCHVCCVCGFQTRHTASLAKHMMLHRDYKPYKCAQCSFTALFPSEIISHAKSRHLKQKQYSCPKCPFKTSYALAIRKHIARHDGVKGYACSICGEALESMLKAKKHMVNDHGCNDYQIIQEQSVEKVKPSDYKIANLKKDRIENAYVTLNSQKINEKLDQKPDAESTSHEMVSELLDVPLPSESITDTNSSKALSPERNIYTNNVPSSKGGNPMLCATTTNLNDNDNSMIEDSLFDLMSDFPRPPTLNRCQSASTLMFASFSPHLVDRPLTPDFFTDSPSVGSFFTNYTSKNLEPEALTLGTFESNAHSMSVPQSNSILISSRAVNPPSPILPSFVSSPGVGSLTSMSNVTLAQLPVQESVCMDLDTILPSTVLSNPPKQKTSRTQCIDKKISRIPFATTKSAFTSISTDFSPEIQAAVASIPLPEDSTQNICLTEESPFPSQI